MMERILSKGEHGCIQEKNQMIHESFNRYRMTDIVYTSRLRIMSLGRPTCPPTQRFNRSVTATSSLAHDLLNSSVPRSPFSHGKHGFLPLPPTNAYLRATRVYFEFYMLGVVKHDFFVILTKHATNTPSLWFRSRSSLHSRIKRLTPSNSTTCFETSTSLHNLNDVHTS